MGGCWKDLGWKGGIGLQYDSGCVFKVRCQNERRYREREAKPDDIDLRGDPADHAEIFRYTARLVA